MIIAREVDEVIGFVEVGLLPLPSNRVPFDGTPAPSDLHLYPTIGNLLTASSHRRQGIGRELMRRAEIAAKGWGYDSIVCAVDPANEKAYSLYASLGYVPRFSSVTSTQVNLQRKRVIYHVLVKELAPALGPNPDPDPGPDPDPLAIEDGGQSSELTESES